MTGAALVEMLATGVFQISRGLSYQVDLTRPRRERVDRATITLGGRPIDPAAEIRVTTSDFIWNGGDGCGCREPRHARCRHDIDLFIAYIEKHSPVPPGHGPDHSKAHEALPSTSQLWHGQFGIVSRERE